ncbi:hypothetical protein D5086_000744 [Populus alba]|uniref:Uncharacterized protein n=1 Tax=Populus alba TaxID=43335 RepID=A0ACC4CXH1_POPAL
MSILLLYFCASGGDDIFVLLSFKLTRRYGLDTILDLPSLDQLPEDKVYSKAVLVSIKNQWFRNTAGGIKRRGAPQHDPFSFGKLPD